MGAKKEGRPHHDCSVDARQGAHKNSAWPTPPFGGDSTALLLVFKGPKGPGWRFLRKQNQLSLVVELLVWP